ncbi:HEPN domain protein [Ferroglobus placidus DSM 10642]|uniref:HEPN domain protein n=1 Tax=Ferroglobus placidus (strain DSM 10642 / AEDII12DO) TaxID=589924 RepID=D3S252_FERPA|nr:HEPN domain-containing protein [Ferroglobus placidus]ADC66543.1 HEPN domain protein [Ferroglobus placidus DSM 10642]
MRREVALWLKAAEDDVYDAELFFKNSRYFRTAFFSQQAVEKAFKAMFFIVKKEDPPKIHTVTELYAELKKSGFNLPKEIEEQLYILNKYYTVSRYPDAANGLPSESVDKIEAERALKIAKEVLDYAKKFAEESNRSG